MNNPNWTQSYLLLLGGAQKHMPRATHAMENYSFMEWLALVCCGIFYLLKNNMECRYPASFKMRFFLMLKKIYQCMEFTILLNLSLFTWSFLRVSEISSPASFMVFWHTTNFLFRKISHAGILYSHLITLLPPTLSVFSVFPSQIPVPFFYDY